MTTQHSTVSQTRSFSTVFMIEMWERFGFYGMQVLMVTYMMKKLGFVDTRANLVWGAAAALIYATPAIGGWVGDKLLGTRRTMTIGAAVLAVGYALLWLPTNNAFFLYGALGVIIVGNGFFKPNAGNLVRKIYEGDETKIDSAFTMYYMAVNIGSMISMTLTPWIRDYIGATLRRLGGLAHGLRRLLDRPADRHDELLSDAPRARPHRLARRTRHRLISSGSSAPWPARSSWWSSPSSSCRASRWHGFACMPRARWCSGFSSI